MQQPFEELSLVDFTCFSYPVSLVDRQFSVMKSRFWWAGHVAQVGGERNSGFGLRNLWETANIKVGLRETVCEDRRWMEILSIKWYVLVLTVQIFYVLLPESQFISCETCILERCSSISRIFGSVSQQKNQPF